METAGATPPTLRLGLAAKLAICLVPAVLTGFLLFVYLHQRLEQRQLESLVGLSAERISDVVHSSAWRAMLINDREALYTLIQDFGREPGIRRVRIINEDGLVRHSTDSSEVGTYIDKSAEACYACHAQSQPIAKIDSKQRIRIFRDNPGHRTLAIIRPVENQPDCSSAACHAHPATRHILGVIDVHLTLDAVDAQLAEHRLQAAVFTAGAAVIACLLSLAFVFLVVHRPVRELMHAAGKLRRGHLSHRIRSESGDELGELARSFNEMAVNLEAAQTELRDWADTLEARVRQKTDELEKAHRGLVANEKMASLGRLAATVAHEVNNPLFGMLTYARLTLKDLDKTGIDPALKERMEEHLHIIERESRRCGGLMKNLLAFARQKQPERSPTDVNGVAERAISLVAHKLELAQITLERQFDANLPEVMGDAGQIQQVILILLVNAAEALPPGGVIRISTSLLAAPAGVAITISDNGPGIPPDLQEKIFEPFFTTKESQHRTGLGLAVARTIMERHGGSIRLRSTPCQGAEFTVQLPLEVSAELVAQGRGEQTV